MTEFPVDMMLQSNKRKDVGLGQRAFWDWVLDQRWFIGWHLYTRPQWWHQLGIGVAVGETFGEGARAYAKPEI